MGSTIDITKPEDGIPASKADLRTNLAAARAEIDHGGFFRRDVASAVERQVRNVLAERGKWLTDYAGADFDTRLGSLIADLADGDVVVIPPGTHTALTGHTITGRSGITVLLQPGSKVVMGAVEWGNGKAAGPALLDFQNCHDVLVVGGEWDGNSDANAATSYQSATLAFVSNPGNAMTPSVLSARVKVHDARFINILDCAIFTRFVDDVRIENCEFIRNANNSGRRANAWEGCPLVALMAGSRHRVVDSRFDGGMPDDNAGVGWRGSDIMRDQCGVLLSMPNPRQFREAVGNSVRAWELDASFTAPTGTATTTLTLSSNTNFTETDPEIRYDIAKMDWSSICDPNGGPEVGPDRLAVTAMNHATFQITVELRDKDGVATNFNGQRFVLRGVRREGGFQRDVVIRGNTFRRFRGVGTFPWYVDQLLIEGNVAEDCLDIGLDVEQSLNFQVVGNTVRRTPAVNFTGNAIAVLYGCRNGVVANNTVDGWGWLYLGGINVNNNGKLATDILIADNIIHGGHIEVTAKTLGSSGGLSRVRITGNHLLAAKGGGAGLNSDHMLKLTGEVWPGAYLRDVIFADNFAMGAKLAPIRYTNVDGLIVRDNDVQAGHTQALAYEEATSASRNVVFCRNFLRAPSIQDEWQQVVEHAGTLTEQPLMYGNIIQVSGTNRAANPSLEKHAPGQLTPRGPTAVQVGGIWLRDNGGVLEKSADTTTGADGTWTPL